VFIGFADKLAFEFIFDNPWNVKISLEPPREVEDVPDFIRAVGPTAKNIGVEIEPFGRGGHNVQNRSTDLIESREAIRDWTWLSMGYLNLWRPKDPLVERRGAETWVIVI
jgi:hypothetical protein